MPVAAPGMGIYEVNTVGGTSIYSPQGKSIKVNPNYLKRHTLYTTDRRLALEQLIYDPYVMNILVPISLQQYEKKFVDSF